MGRLQRSWSILKSSFNLLGNNKTLLFFPIINFVIVLFICSLFILPAGFYFYETYGDGFSNEKIGQKTIAAAPAAQSTAQTEAEYNDGQAMTTTEWIIWVSLYIFSVFVATYLNVAFYTEILNALKGGSVDIANGFKTANSKILQIFFWACLAGSVGLIIKMIEEKLDFVGQIIMKIIGIAWSIAALFVIPVIVTEELTNRNPFSYLKKSSSIIVKTWGESLVGYVGFGVLNGLVFFCSFVAVLGFDIFAVTVIKGQIGGTLAIAVSVAWVILIIAFMYIVSVAEKIYRGALYLYASEGLIPEQYSQEVMETAWKTKKK